MNRLSGRAMIRVLLVSLVFSTLTSGVGFAGTVGVAPAERSAPPDSGDSARGASGSRQLAPDLKATLSSGALGKPSLREHYTTASVDAWSQTGTERPIGDYKSSGGFGAWWNSASKTTKTWTIVGAVLFVGISAAALSED